MKTGYIITKTISRAPAKYSHQNIPSQVPPDQPHTAYQAKLTTSPLNRPMLFRQMRHEDIQVSINLGRLLCRRAAKDTTKRAAGSIRIKP
ncbi:hypothetical protein N7453_008532 [Penicillium expansum]|nr:hypothetical protein N7453_008532 [Penicillium expansum]